MDMQKLMRQAQQMQAEVAKAQESLAFETVEASTGGGMVQVTATGTGVIKSIRIDPEAVDTDDIELLEDMVLAAVNEAHRAASALAESKMNSAVPGGLGGLGLPGM
jgi:DNA-binding YbaB/EbfC family protein